MRIETLERRRLLTATVTETYPGFYEIHGGSGDDTIIVSVSQLEETFTFDGQAYGGLSFVSIFGYEGNDTISILTSDGPGFIGTAISAGNGDDQITVNFDGSIWGGSGSDVMYLSDSFRGEVYGEGGDDEMYISGECMDPQIMGGDGNDLIDASANNYGVVMRGGNGDDTLYGTDYSDQIYGDGGADVMYGGGGNDTFYAVDGSALDHIDGGGGNDILRADSSGEASVNGIEQIIYG